MIYRSLPWLFTLWFVFDAATAKTQSVVQVPDLGTFSREPYADLDPDEIRTGYLMDAALALAPLASYDGTPGQNGEDNVSAGLYEELFATAASASVSEEAFSRFRDRPHLDYPGVAGATAHLAGLILEYDYLSEEALENGLIAENASTGTLQRQRSGNLYRQGRVAAFTVAEHEIGANTTHYVFNKSDLVTNLPIGDYFVARLNNRWQRVDFGEPFTYEFTSSTRDLYIKVYTPLGTVYGSISLRKQRLNERPVASRTVCNQFAVPFNGGVITATLNVNGNECTDCQLDNPLIVVNGFDDGNDEAPRLERLIGEFTIEGNETSPYAGVTLEDALLIDSGYDILFVDFIDGTASNFTTAEWLINAMTVIEDMKEDAGIGEMEVPMIGVSMGGLVSKIALSRMEQRGIPHYVNKWFTFDSPLRGAYIPIGLQHVLHHFAGSEIWGVNLLDFTTRNGINRLADVGRMHATLTSPGAQEMLLYSVRTTINYRSGTLFSPRLARIEHSVRTDLHDAFQARFDAESHRVPHYAISNGARDQDQTEVEPGEVADLGVSTPMLTINLGYPSAAQPFGFSWQNVRMEARTLPRTFKLTRSRWPLFSQVTYRANHDDITPNLDLVAGGTRAQDEIEDAGVHVNYTQFIPTTSSQNLPLGTSLDVSGPGVDYRVIPTDELLDSRTDDDFQVFNHEHVAVTPQIVTFLIDALAEVDDITPGNTDTRVLTTRYNFGAGVVRGVRRATPTTLGGSHAVQSGGVLGFNQAERIGNVDNVANPLASEEPFEVRLTTDDCAGPANIFVGSDSKIVIGSLGRPATVTMEPGTEITIGFRGSLHIAPGSKLVIGAGARVNIQNYSSLFNEGAVEVVQGGFLDIEARGSLYVRRTGAVRVTYGSTLSLGEESRLEIIDDSDDTPYVIIESGTLELPGVPLYRGNGALRFIGQPEVRAHVPFTVRGMADSHFHLIFDDALVSVTGNGNVDLAFVDIDYIGTSILRPQPGASVLFETVNCEAHTSVSSGRSVAIQAPWLTGLTLYNSGFVGFHKAVDLNDEAGSPRSGDVQIGNVGFQASEVFLERVGEVNIENANFHSESILGRLDIRDAGDVYLKGGSLTGFSQGYKPTLAPAAARVVDATSFTSDGTYFGDNDLGLQCIRCGSVNMSCVTFFENYQGATIEDDEVSIDRSGFYSNTGGIIGSDIDLRIERTTVEHDCEEEAFLRLRYADLPVPDAANPVKAEHNLWNGSTASPDLCNFTISYLGNVLDPPYVDTYPRSTVTGCSLNGRSAIAIDSSRGSLESFEVPALSLSPNPAGSSVDVALQNFEPESITLYDATGRALDLVPSETRLNVADLPDGVYRVIAIDATGKRLSETLAVRH